MPTEDAGGSAEAAGPLDKTVRRLLAGRRGRSLLFASGARALNGWAPRRAGPWQMWCRLVCFAGMPLDDARPHRVGFGVLTTMLFLRIVSEVPWIDVHDDYCVAVQRAHERPLLLWDRIYLEEEACDNTFVARGS